MSIRTLTNPEPPENRLISEYGTTTYKEWCELELKRISRKHYFLQQDPNNGYVCIKYHPTEEENLIAGGW